MEKLICSSAEFVGLIEETVGSGGTMPIVVTGNSMRPFLKDGEHTVWLERCTDSDFKRGRILLFRRTNGKIVLHRVRKVRPDGVLVMNGDAQNWCENIEKNQVLAVVTHIEANGKKKPCNSLFYRMRTEIWQLLMPVRPFVFRAVRKIRRTFRKSER